MADAADGPKFSTPGQGLVEYLAVTRQMKVYAVSENELQHVSLLNVLSMAFYSVGSALLSFAGTIWLAAQFDGTESPVSKVLYGYVMPTAAVLALVFYGLGLFTQRNRGAVISTIKRESKPPAP